MNEHSAGLIGRRALFAAGIGAIATAAANAFGRPGVALGANGDALRIGRGNSGSNATTLTVGGDPALKCVSNGHDGMWGQTKAAKRSGVYGYAAHGDGVGVTGRNTANGVTGSLGGKAAVKAQASGEKIALDVVGRARFSRSGGIKVPKGERTAHLEFPQGTATSATKVIATIQTPDPNNYGLALSSAHAWDGAEYSQLTVRLTEEANEDVWVAWIMFE